jgi:hypothetical protein
MVRYEDYHWDSVARPVLVLKTVRQILSRSKAKVDKIGVVTSNDLRWCNAEIGEWKVCTLGMALGLVPGCRSGHLAVNLVEPHLAEGPEYSLLEHPGANK